MGDGGVTPHTGLKSECRQNAAPEGSSGGGDAFRVGINPRFSRLAFTATFRIAIPLCFSPKPGVDVPGGTGGCGRAPTLWMGHEGCPPRCSPRVFLLLRQRRARLLARRTGILQQELPRVGTELAPPVSHIDTPPPPQDAELRGRRALCAPPTRVITPIRTKCGAGRGAAGIIWGCKECSVGGGGTQGAAPPPGAARGRAQRAASAVPCCFHPLPVCSLAAWNVAFAPISGWSFGRRLLLFQFRRSHYIFHYLKERGEGGERKKERKKNHQTQKRESCFPSRIPTHGSAQHNLCSLPAPGRAWGHPWVLHPAGWGAEQHRRPPDKSGSVPHPLHPHPPNNRALLTPKPLLCSKAPPPKAPRPSPSVDAACPPPKTPAPPGGFGCVLSAQEAQNGSMLQRWSSAALCFAPQRCVLHRKGRGGGGGEGLFW